LGAEIRGPVTTGKRQTTEEFGAPVVGVSARFPLRGVDLAL